MKHSPHPSRTGRRSKIELGLALILLFSSGDPAKRLHAQVNSPHSVIYVAPNGSSGSSGAKSSPLDLVSALKPGRVPPGSTILLQGGVYPGPFRSDLKGTQSEPITMRSAPGENAVITTYTPRGDGGVLNVYGEWTIYRDFEVTVSSRDRAYASQFRLMGLNILAPHTKFINLVVHDAGHGFGFWSQAEDSEIYGNIIFNNGSQNSPTDMRHGHAIYTQNTTGRKLIRNNIMFDQFGWGIHAYPSPGGVSGFLIEGNVSFSNGLASHPDEHYNNLLVSGHKPFKTDQIVIRNNYTWYPAGQKQTDKFTGADVCLGCSDPEENGTATITGNYLVNGSPVVLANGWDSLQFSGNTVVGDGLMVSLTLPGRKISYALNSNQYFATAGPPLFSLNGSNLDAAAWRARGWDADSRMTNARPSGSAVFVQPNEYEPGRGHVVVYNWDRAGSVSVNPSTILKPGAYYQVFNVQDLAGSPALAGNWTGGNLQFPMGAPKVQLPSGRESELRGTELASGPDFNVFLIVSTTASQPAAPVSSTSAVTKAPDPLAKLRPFEGEYSSGNSHAVIIASPSGFDIRILSEPSAPQYHLTQANGPRFRIDSMPAGFFVDFDVKGQRVIGLSLTRGPLPKVYLIKQSQAR
jgi:hypothetical protein